MEQLWGGGCRREEGNGKKAREGLFRAIENPEARTQNPEEDLSKRWKEASRRYRRLMGLALEWKAGTTRDFQTQDGRKDATGDRPQLPELSVAKMLRCRVRYFTDGVVIRTKEFVKNEAFAGPRERFSEKRKDGARRMRGMQRLRLAPCGVLGPPDGSGINGSSAD